jgi:hypothetical protein
LSPVCSLQWPIILFIGGSIGPVKSRRSSKCFCANVWSNWELACKYTSCTAETLSKVSFWPFSGGLILFFPWKAGSGVCPCDMWWVGIDADRHSSMYDPFVFQEIRSAELRTEIAQVLHGYKQVCRQTDIPFVCLVFYFCNSGWKVRCGNTCTLTISSFTY